MVQFPPKHPLFVVPFLDGFHVRTIFSPKTLPRLLIPYIIQRGASYGRDESFGPGDDGGRKRVLVEFSSPNIGKEFTAAHLRSTLLGKHVARTYESAGYEVVRMNYLGDWGKDIGLLGEGWKRYGSEEELEKDPIRHVSHVFAKMMEQFQPELEAARKANNETKSRIHSKGLFAARDAFFSRMEAGDPEAVAFAHRIRDLCVTQYKDVYARLGIRFDEYSGESRVLDMIPEVEAALREKGLIEEPEGDYHRINFEAHAGIPTAFGQGGTQTTLRPGQLRDRTGTSMYLLRDLAAVFVRLGESPRDSGKAKKTDANAGFDKILYVVSSEQDVHFRQIVRAVELLGRPDVAAKLQHVGFSANPGLTAALSGDGNSKLLLSDILDRCASNFTAEPLETMKSAFNVQFASSQPPAPAMAEQATQTEATAPTEESPPVGDPATAIETVPVAEAAPIAEATADPGVAPGEAERSVETDTVEEAAPVAGEEPTGEPEPESVAEPATAEAPEPEEATPPVEEAVAVDQAVLLDKSVPGEEPAHTEEAAAVEESAPAEETIPAEEVASTEEAVNEDKVEGIDPTAPEEGPAPEGTVPTAEEPALDGEAAPDAAVPPDEVTLPEETPLPVERALADEEPAPMSEGAPEAAAAPVEATIAGEAAPAGDVPVEAGAAPEHPTPHDDEGYLGDGAAPGVESEMADKAAPDDYMSLAQAAALSAGPVDGAPDVMPSSEAAGAEAVPAPDVEPALDETPPPPEPAAAAAAAGKVPAISSQAAYQSVEDCAATAALSVAELAPARRQHQQKHAVVDPESLSSLQDDSGMSLLLAYGRLRRRIRLLGGDEGPISAETLAHPHSLLEKQPWCDVLRLLAQFPEVCGLVYSSAEPGPLVTYLFRVVTELVPCLDDEEYGGQEGGAGEGGGGGGEGAAESSAAGESRRHRDESKRALFECVRIVLENGMEMLGIPVMEVLA